ncbi:hypothetical protein [Neobacillus mesonae]|nr:hypothetical protein [Neobacillus mesonae]MCM3568218.1 hypothetical protein [Neobacillus mesonae]
MTISEKLTQQKFQEILVSTYLMGREKERLTVNEMIEEIKQQILKEKNN